MRTLLLSWILLIVSFGALGQNARPQSESAKLQSVEKKDAHLFKTYDIPFKEDSNVKYEFPKLRRIDGYEVMPVGTVLGIEYSYIMEVDAEADFDGFSDTYYDIDILAVNRTGKKLVFDDPRDAVGFIKFTGENTEAFLNHGKIVTNLGGKCTFYADFLDYEDGKYVMYPDEEYEGYYTINQDSEGWLEMLTLRRMKPLAVETSIPNGQYEQGFETQFTFFDVNGASFAPSIGSKSTSLKIDLPDEMIEATSAIRGIENDPILSDEGGYKVALTNDRLKITYQVSYAYTLGKGSGYLEYPITVRVQNISGETIDSRMYPYGTIGYMRFWNCRSIPLKIWKQTGKGKYDYSRGGLTDMFEPGEVNEYVIQMEVNPFSGELYQGRRFSERAVDRDRSFSPKYIKLAKDLARDINVEQMASSDNKTRLHIFIKPADIRDFPTASTADPTLAQSFKNYNKNLIHQYLSDNPSRSRNDAMGTVVTYELSGGGNYGLFMGHGIELNEKRISKLKQKGNTIYGTYDPVEVKEGTEVFVVYKMGKIHVMSNEDFDDLVNGTETPVTRTSVQY